MTQPSEKKNTETKSILEAIEDSRGFFHGKQEKKDIYVRKLNS